MIIKKHTLSKKSARGMVVRLLTNFRLERQEDIKKIPYSKKELSIMLNTYKKTIDRIIEMKVYTSASYEVLLPLVTLYCSTKFVTK